MDEQDIERQTIEETEPMESLSKEELHEKIIEDKKRANRSLILAFSALVAVVVVCLAWFVLNNLTQGTSANIASDTEVRFQLASVGERQKTELNHLWQTSVEETVLSAGTDKTYSEYFDTDKREKVKVSQEYQVGSNNLAWYLADQMQVEPGATGKLEFYVIPKMAGLTSMDVMIQLEAYVNEKEPEAVEDGQVDQTKAIRSSNAVLQNLIDGHILLFRKLDDNTGYSGWLAVNEDTAGDGAFAGVSGNRFTLKASDLGLTVFEANEPYKITLYWVWPKYFRNYIYGARNVNGDLFTDISADNADYTALIDFINDQKKMDAAGSSRLFYSKDADVTQVTDQRIDKEMKAETLAACNRYYNQADEYIGTETQYLLINVSVE